MLYRREDSLLIRILAILMTTNTLSLQVARPPLRHSSHQNHHATPPNNRRRAREYTLPTNARRCLISRDRIPDSMGFVPLSCENRVRCSASSCRKRLIDYSRPRRWTAVWMANGRSLETLGRDENVRLDRSVTGTCFYRNLWWDVSGWPLNSVYSMYSQHFILSLIHTMQHPSNKLIIQSNPNIQTYPQTPTRTSNSKSTQIIHFAISP